MDERTLVQKVLAKDAEAERFFVETFRPKLVRYASFVLGYHDPDVEDTVQETLVAAFRELPSFRFHCVLQSWLKRICANRCFNRIRKRKWQVASIEGDLDLFARDASMEKSAESERESARQILLDIVRREREAMDEPCRSILKYRDGRNMSYSGISGILKVPIGTVMSRLARCKEALKERVMTAIKSLEKP